MLDLIICANFGVEKLRGLGNTRGQILEFPIEMAGHLYNRAGATAQPVIRSGLNWAAQRRRLKHVTTLQDYYYLVNCYIFVIAQTVADDQLPSVESRTQKDPETGASFNRQWTDGRMDRWPWWMAVHAWGRSPTKLTSDQFSACGLFTDEEKCQPSFAVVLSRS